MATPQELRAIEEAQRAAQARLGLLAAYLVLRDWGGGEGSITSTAASWISPAIRIIMAVRRKSMRLARRYYRLARAIETGSTLGLPDSMTEGTKITLGVLREEYQEILEEIANLGTEVTADDPDEKFFEQKSQSDKPDPNTPQGSREDLFNAVDLQAYIDEWLESEANNDGDFVTVDDFDWGLTEDESEELKQAFEQAIRKDVVEVGDRRISQIRQSNANSDAVVIQLEKQNQDSGSHAAGRVDRYGINAGRDVINFAIQQDRKVKLVARGLGPNPCSFCAMLASRGFVYKDKSAAGTPDGDDTIKKYHDNCHCYPIVRWVDASQLPAANQWLQDQWATVTSGYSGLDARNAWRRWFNKTGRDELWKHVEDLANQPQAA